MWFNVINIVANGDGTSGNVSRSMPSSPGDRNRQPQQSIPVVGSAENLVGRVSWLRLEKSIVYTVTTITSLLYKFPLHIDI